MFNQFKVRKEAIK